VFLSPHAFRAAAEEIPHLFIGRLRKVFVELTYPIEWFWCDSADNLVCFVYSFRIAWERAGAARGLCLCCVDREQGKPVLPLEHFAVSPEAASEIRGSYCADSLFLA
jgi:hypothetical protein